MQPPHIAYRPEKVTPAAAMSLLDEELRLARRRRSVRFFSDRAVPRAMIERLIGIASTAPSGANLQPWHFVAIDDPGLKQRIRHAAEQAERDFYDRRAPQEWLSVLQPLGTDWRKPFLEIAPWLIVVFRQRWRIINGRRQKTYYSSESVGIAVGLMIAAIHRAGLVTLTHTPAPMDFLREICERPANESAFVVLPVGYPADDCTVPNIARRPLQDVLQWNVSGQ